MSEQPQEIEMEESINYIHYIVEVVSETVTTTTVVVDEQKVEITTVEDETRWAQPASLRLSKDSNDNEDEKSIYYSNLIIK